MRTRFRLLLTALLASSAILGLVGEPLSASTPRSLTFQVRVDDRLAGAQWTLTTMTGASQLDTLLLGNGTIDDAAEPVRTSVSVVDAARSTSLQFVLRFYKRLDSSHALVATASAGLLRRDVLRGGLVDLGARETLVSRTHATAAEALAASSCGLS